MTLLSAYSITTRCELPLNHKYSGIFALSPQAGCADSPLVEIWVVTALVEQMVCAVSMGNIRSSAASSGLKPTLLSAVGAEQALTNTALVMSTTRRSRTLGVKGLVNSLTPRLLERLLVRLQNRSSPSPPKRPMSSTFLKSDLRSPQTAHQRHRLQTSLNRHLRLLQPPGGRRNVMILP